MLTGAGDQGLMFGYATDETEECMPLTVVLAHKLNAKIAELRRNGGLPWARPDSKTQVLCWANDRIVNIKRATSKYVDYSCNDTYFGVFFNFDFIFDHVNCEYLFS